MLCTAAKYSSSYFTADAINYLLNHFIIAKFS